MIITTRERILNAAVKLWPNITLEAVAEKIGMTHPTILYHFPDDTLRDAVAEHAVAIGESRVIVALIAENHSAIGHLSVTSRMRHFKAI